MGCSHSSPATPHLTRPRATVYGAPRASDWLAERVGCATKAGIDSRGGSMEAKAKLNQDSGLVVWPFNGSTSEALFGVFDGHGTNGEAISQFCARELEAWLSADVEALHADPLHHLASQIVQLDRHLSLDPVLGKVAENAGTTCTVVYVKGSMAYVAGTRDPAQLCV